MLIEILFFLTKFKVELNITTTSAFATVGFVSLFPLFYLFKYLANPKRCTVKKVSGDSILTASIIVFNLLLITLAVSLLSNVDFSNLRSLLLFVITPAVLFFDILIYFVVKFIFAKSNYFKFKKNIDAALILSDKNRFYFTQFASTAGILVLAPSKQPVFFTYPR